MNGYFDDTFWLFSPDSFTSKSEDETFLQDFLVILKHSRQCYRRFGSPTTHWLVTRRE